MVSFHLIFIYINLIKFYKIDLKQITFTQFLTIIAYKINTNDTEEELEEAFRMFDRTDSGFIT
jgi:Ca2+-binding EF-hand superfamily protein